MKRKVYLGIITAAALCISLPGCGKIENDTSSSTPSATPVSESSNSSNTTEPVATEVPEETASPADTTETPVQEPPQVDEPVTPEQTPAAEIKTEKLSASQDYSDAYRLVKVLGLKEYKKLDSDKYNDKAKKGKKFLVLFLSIRNDTSEEDYINYNYISAKVDGKKIEHTFLLNDPKGYPSIFSHVPANEGIGGFIVWEVPSVWKTLEFKYNGWKDINNISLEAKFTPDDLSDPVIYNANDFK